MTLLPLLMIVIAAILIGVPVILAITMAGVAGIAADPTLVLAMFSHKMFASMDSFSLLAMPYFILAGTLMSRGGMSRELVEFAEDLVGHMRGGLAKAAVVSCMIFANLSGSATADTAAIGSVTIPEMKKRGYKAGFAAGLVACAGTMGPVIPPSLTFIIYGSITGVSIGGLFVAGILPGVLIGLALIVCVHLASFTKRYSEMAVTRPRKRLRVVAKSVARVWAALLTPVIILGGILGGIFTATEAGIVTCIYALCVSLFIYKSLTWRDLPDVLLEAAMITGTVMGILAVAGAFGWLLAYNNFAVNVVASITSLTNNRYAVLAILLGLMLLLTVFIESLAVLIVLIPVAMEITTRFSFDPYHVGVLMVVATQIGAVTPPVAVLLYVSSRIAEIPFEDSVKDGWPAILTLFVVLGILFAVPEISTLIPRAVFG
jgi:tripartite ATP-independent transporter DctM subunit